MNRTENGWAAPERIDFGEEFKYRCSHPSLATNGNLYFQAPPVGDGSADIYFSRYENGRYSKPEKLSSTVNSKYHDCHPYIAPDESYLIFDCNISTDSSIGGEDLNICFRDRNCEWMEAQNLGKKVNSKYDDRRPFVTFDGKYFFFVSFRTELPQLPEKQIALSEIHKLVFGPENGSSDFYWINADFIEELMPKNAK